MIKFSNASLWVRDQQEAHDFYTAKVGWAVHSDFTMPEMGNFRWLVVGPVEQPEIGVALIALPEGPPVTDAATASKLRDVVSQGVAGTLFLTTDDIESAYAELVGRGVEFQEKPEQRPYGIDSSFRDPSGNTIRLTQLPG
jgi:predicted enzyme related to lactoylglutathione lyase